MTKSKREKKNPELENSSWGLSKGGLHFLVHKSLERLGFHTPTKIQRKAIPQIIDIPKSDFFICGRTGSGKTLTFLLPIVNFMHNNNELEGTDRKTLAMIITPTRELAKQIHKLFLCFLEPAKNQSVACVIGGLNELKQIRILKKNTKIVVGTPGRIWGLSDLDQGKCEELGRSFTDLRYFVLDEADEVVTSQSHLRDVTRILQVIHNQHRTKRFQKILVSASLLMNEGDSNDSLYSCLDIANPLIIFEDKLINSPQKKQQISWPDNITIELLNHEEFDRHSILLLLFLDIFKRKYKTTKIIVFVNSISAATKNKRMFDFILKNNSLSVQHLGDNISHPSEKETKNESRHLKTSCRVLSSPAAMLLQSLQDEKPKTKIEGDNFIPSVKRCKVISSTKTMKVDLICLHSKLQQKQRLKRLETFGNSSLAVLFCTDIAARGIDFEGATHVIHMHDPRNPKLFLHRSGRTARMQNEGKCICMCSAENYQNWRNVLTSVGIELDRVHTCDLLKNTPVALFKCVSLLTKLTSDLDLLLSDKFNNAKDMEISRQLGQDEGTVEWTEEESQKVEELKNRISYILPKIHNHFK